MWRLNIPPPVTRTGTHWYVPCLHLLYLNMIGARRRTNARRSMWGVGQQPMDGDVLLDLVEAVPHELWSSL